MFRRGASQVLITILLVGFAITAGLVVMNWMTKQSEEVSEEGVSFIEGHTYCREVFFNARANDDNCNTVVIKNKGYFTIGKFYVRKVDEGVEIIPVVETDTGLFGCSDKGLVIKGCVGIESGLVGVGVLGREVKPNEEITFTVGNLEFEEG